MTLAALMLAATAASAEPLASHVWIHGAPDCTANRDPPIDVVAVDADSYVLRQNKCLHVEAPFIYVLFGRHTVLVEDTGATADPARFPLLETIRGLIARRGPSGVRMLVVHSHGHADHHGADAQFRGQPGVTLVEPDGDAVRSHFGFARWPEGEAVVDLGGRQVTVLPIPGHHDASIALYDERTGWLLTGDTVYPGRLYVMDWDAYRASVRRLAQFAETHAVSAVLGTHIEISATGALFPPGARHQPGEASLVLTVEDLRRLDGALREAASRRTIERDRFVVTPVGGFWRTVATVLDWLGLE